MTKIAILDDYIGVALEYGDWTVRPEDAEITVYRQAIPSERLVDELSDYEVIDITQQRARFPRAVLEGLPNLKLIVCNGRTSHVVDHEARIERGCPYVRGASRLRTHRPYPEANLVAVPSYGHGCHLARHYVSVSGPRRHSARADAHPWSEEDRG
jgi:hypothetical protein